MGVLTVRETVRLFRSYYPCPLPLVEVLALAGLEEVADQRVMRLSRAAPAALLRAGDLWRPRGALSREPTAGMDVEGAARFSPACAQPPALARRLC